jgi:membrane-bound lytic murein transglycosylase D
MLKKWIVFSVILLWSQAEAALVAPDSQWTVPNGSRFSSQVRFWIQINSAYSSRQGVIHDAEYVDHIYEVLDFKRSRHRSGHLIGQARAKWHRILLSVHKKQLHPERMNADERTVFEMFRDISEPNKFLDAAHRKRLRFQLGQRDNFLSGLYQSGKYLKTMEEVFRKFDLPIELARLPFVESSFNLHARSKVGASGIWQFMKSTARLFLQVNDAVDERNDPVRASEAAAQLLQLNFESLGNWPLAVTAYNHGRKALMRSSRRVGSGRLEDLIENYRGRSFGFASTNFFAELVASVELERNPTAYFTSPDRAAQEEFFEVRLPDYIQLSDLIRQFNLDAEKTRDLNPALNEAVLQGQLLIPSGYLLRLPKVSNEAQEVSVRNFLEKYELMPKQLKEAAQRIIKYDRRTQR